MPVSSVAYSRAAASRIIRASATARGDSKQKPRSAWPRQQSQVSEAK